MQTTLQTMRLTHSLSTLIRPSNTLSLSSICRILPSSTTTIVASHTSFSFTPIRHKSSHSTRQERPPQIMRRSFAGIFVGKHTRFGNNVSHSERKTRRSWLPNIQRKKFYSDILGREVEIKVSTAAIRTFDKYGGFERFLLRTPYHRLDYGYSRALRLTLELRLLNDPQLAHDLNLQDVLERLKKPSEVKKLQALIKERQEWAKSVGHVNHPILKQTLTDARLAPKLAPLTEEQLQQRQQLLLDQRNARWSRRAAAKAAGLPAHLKARQQNGIIVPKNVALAPAPTGKLKRTSATFKHPFTKPTRGAAKKAAERARLAKEAQEAAAAAGGATAQAIQQ